MGSRTAQPVAWKRRRSPPASETSARSAEIDAPRKCPRTDSRAAQPAYAQTSLDALVDIEHCIHAANARHFTIWKRDNTFEKRQSCSRLVGHIQSAIRHRFASSAEHRLHRMNLIVEFANTMYQNEEQMPIEHQIDKWVLNDCLPLIAKEVEAKKRALKYVIGGGAEQPDSDCRE